MGWNPYLLGGCGVPKRVVRTARAALAATAMVVAAAALPAQPASEAHATTIAANNAEIPSSRCDALSLGIGAIKGAEKLSRILRGEISDRLKAVRQAKTSAERAKAIKELNEYKTKSLTEMRGVIGRALDVFNDANKIAKEKPDVFSDGLSDGIGDGQLLLDQALTQIDAAIRRVPGNLDNIPITQLWGNGDGQKPEDIPDEIISIMYDPNRDDTTIVLQGVGGHLKLIMPTLEDIQKSVQPFCSMKKTEAAPSEEELLNEPG